MFESVVFGFLFEFARICHFFILIRSTVRWSVVVVLVAGCLCVEMAGVRDLGSIFGIFWFLIRTTVRRLAVVVFAASDLCVGWHGYRGRSYLESTLRSDTF